MEELAVLVGPTLGLSRRGEAQVRVAWAGCARELRILELPHRGLQPVEASYAALEPMLLRWSELRPLVLAGWSQGGLIAVLFALRHPNRVRQLLVLAPPFAGTPRAHLVAWSSPFVAQMRPGSLWLRQFADEVATGAAGLPETHVLVALRDAVVPVGSSLLPAAAQATYHCFGSRPASELRLPQELVVGYVWARGVGHLNLAFHPAVVRRLRQIVLGVAVEPAATSWRPEAEPFSA
ncbi:MAG TPA: alpha/beta fold hydrolase [Candidatus Saccharimonadia bacterium]|nr:alpha/beta fold hydrolase [Candidatus Saccharimonadia bacterium]